MRQGSSRVGLKGRERERARERQKEKGVDQREIADKRGGEDSDGVGRSKKDG